MSELMLNRNFTLLKRIALGFAAFLFAFYWWNGILPHQLAFAPLFDVSLDNTFWLFHLTGIPKFLISKPSLLKLIELACLGFGVFAFIKNKQWVNIAFLFFFVLLSLLSQTYSATLTKTSVLFPIVFLPFCLKKERFNQTWKIPRDYLVFLMVSAGLFKLINGGVFYKFQMENILFNQHLDLFFYNSQHVSNKALSIFEANVSISKLAYIAMFFIECSFVVLLFTRKLDKLFLVVLVLFCVAIYLVMRINTIEMLVLTMPLLSFYNSND